MIPVGCEEQCPGCRYRNYSAQESAERKSKYVNSVLQDYSSVIQELRVPHKRWQYRQRSVMHARQKEGRWHFGLIKKIGREEYFVAIPDCPIHIPFINQVAALLSDRLPADLPLHFLLVSGSCVTLVFKAKRTNSLVQKLEFLEEPLRRLGVLAFFINWNPVAGHRVLSAKEWSCLWGEAFVQEEGIFHGPSGFRQQIAQMEFEALSEAQAFLQQSGPVEKGQMLRCDHKKTSSVEHLSTPANNLPLEHLVSTSFSTPPSNINTIVDLYSGLGMSLRLWPDYFSRVIGVELVKESCEAAIRNAPRAAILVGRVEERIPQLIQFVGRESFVVYTNPPRMGHERKTIDWLNVSGAQKIVYLSCSMKSLARDLLALSHYSVVKIQPYDFFPQTDHVEALTLLERR